MENWYLDFPAGVGENNLISAAVVWKGWDNFDVTLNKAEPAKGERTVLEVRASTIWHLTFAVFLRGGKILEYRKILSRDAPGTSTTSFMGRPAWEMDILVGVDMSLVCEEYLIPSNQR